MPITFTPPPAHLLPEELRDLAVAAETAGATYREYQRRADDAARAARDADRDHNDDVRRALAAGKKPPADRRAALAVEADAAAQLARTAKQVAADAWHTFARAVQALPVDVLTDADAPVEDAAERYRQALAHLEHARQEHADALRARQWLATGVVGFRGGAGRSTRVVSDWRPHTTPPDDEVKLEGRMIGIRPSDAIAALRGDADRLARIHASEARLIDGRRLDEEARRTNEAMFGASAVA